MVINDENLPWQLHAYRPNQLDEADWLVLQKLAWTAFRSTTPGWLESDIASLANLDDRASFAASHYDPNVAVGTRFVAGQSFTEPKLVVATKDNQPVGYAYAAYNVSGGSEIERKIKSFTIIKDYVWLRELVVDPRHQKKGIATAMGRMLLKQYGKLHPVSTYYWEGVSAEFVPESLKKHGFRETGRQDAPITGADDEPIQEVRMQAASVSKVLNTIKRK